LQPMISAEFIVRKKDTTQKKEDYEIQSLR